MNDAEFVVKLTLTDTWEEACETLNAVLGAASPACSLPQKLLQTHLLIGLEQPRLDLVLIVYLHGVGGDEALENINRWRKKDRLDELCEPGTLGPLAVILDGVVRPLPSSVVSAVEKWHGGLAPRELKDFYTERKVEDEVEFWTNLSYFRLRHLLKTASIECVSNIISIHGIQRRKFVASVLRHHGLRFEKELIELTRNTEAEAYLEEELRRRRITPPSPAPAVGVQGASPMPRPKDPINPAAPPRPPRDDRSAR